jgi:hypothetical protein
MLQKYKFKFCLQKEYLELKKKSDKKKLFFFVIVLKYLLFLTERSVNKK